MNPTEMSRFAVNPVSLDMSRSLFNRNHSVKFSFNCGDVIPFLCEEVLPGDSWSIDTTKVTRVQPLVTPIMDSLVQDVYYFFVPNRLVWSHWVNFMGENTDSAWTPSVEYTVPQLNFPSNGWNVGTIADYLGVPPKVAPDSVTVNALPFRAYALICDQWFRSESLMNPVHVYVDDTTRNGSNGTNQVTSIELGGAPFVACKLPDYFTMALPEPQSGPDVSILDGIKVPVTALSGSDWRVSLDNVDNGGLTFSHRQTTSSSNEWVSTPFSASRNLMVSNSDAGLHPSSDSSASSLITSYVLSPDNLWADFDKGINGSSTFTINQLRQAFAVQRYYEKLARGGRRYIEQIASFFGTHSSDARLQRSEYLGGSRIPLNISQVEQTSATSEVSPQGNVAGLSLTGDISSDVNFSAEEHGWIIGVTVVRYQHTYQQGLERQFSRKDLFDYYNPTFANIGEQPIRRKEIYLAGDGMDDDVFGYQEYAADYRYKPNRVCGEMRSVYTTSLDMWHLADYYTSAPYLSDSWIRESKAPLDRCLAVTSSVSNQLISDFYIEAKVARVMPLYSIPGLIDHH